MNNGNFYNDNHAVEERVWLSISGNVNALLDCGSFIY